MISLKSHPKRPYLMGCFALTLLFTLVSLTFFSHPACATGMMWSTFLGGGSTEAPYAVAVGPTGDIYVVGTTASSDFPITPGTVQPSPGVPTDVVVTRLRADGSTVVWSTYLGGSQSEDGKAITVDAAGNVYVTGNTRSSDFPVTAGAFRTTFAGGISDAFVVKLSPDGRQVLYGTYLGGNWDDYPRALAVDAAGNAFVAGSTNSLDFPVTAGVVMPVRNPSIYDGADGFVTKLNAAGTALVWSTYLGSAGGTDNIFGLALDSSGRPTVVGWTLSPGFPVTANAYDRTFDLRREGYVTRLNATATGYAYSTFIGAEGHDECLGVAVDGTGAAYVTGKTESTGFPVTPGAPQSAFGGGPYDAFAFKLSPTGNALEFSTYLGGTGTDIGYGIATNGSGAAVVTGSTDSGGFPVSGDGFDRTANGGTDCFVTCLTAGVLTYSTYVGGSGAEGGQLAALSNTGRAVIVGATASSTFPTTNGAFDRSLAGTNDDFVSVMDVGVGGALAVEPGVSVNLMSLAPAQPNPYRDRTSFRFTLQNEARVVLAVRDAQGRLVKTVADGVFGAGNHSIAWDGRSNNGSPVPAGLFFVELRSGDSVVAQRIAHLR